MRNNDVPIHILHINSRQYSYKWAINPFFHRVPAILLCPYSRFKIQTPSLRCVAHAFKVFNDGEIGIQKAVHAVLCARLLTLVQSLAADRSRDAFSEADVR
jgi:hypothetical protein